MSHASEPSTLVRCALGFGLLHLLAGCALPPPPHRQATDFGDRFARVQTVTLVPPKIAVFSMTAGNIEEEVEEWSDEASTHLIAAVQNELDELGKTYVPYSGAGPRQYTVVENGARVRETSGPERSGADESWLLFEAVNLAILRHTYDPAHTFRTRIDNFDYTLGREGRALLADTPADAALLVVAKDHVPTKDRAALVGAGLVMGAWKGGYAGPGMTPATLVVALLEARSGDIIWYNVISLPLSDLRDEKTDQVLVDKVMKALSQGGTR